MTDDDLARVTAAPKVELHCHLEGTVRHETVVELARRDGVAHLVEVEPAELWDVVDLDQYLRTYDAVAHLLRGADDFARVVHEHLVSSAAQSLVHTELFWSPMVHLDDGVPYETQLAGLVAGIEAAESDTGVTCRLIPSIDRERPVTEADELLDLVFEHRHELVVGVGLDYSETVGPPHLFVDVFRRAARAGLGRTAHAGEEGDPRVVAETMDALGCRRIDHGYSILADPALTRRAVDEGILFTVCPTAVELLRTWGSPLVGGVPEMVEAGLRIAVGTDAPPQYGTDLVIEARKALDGGVSFDRLDAAVDDAVEGCFLDDAARHELRSRVQAHREAARARSSIVEG